MPDPWDDDLARLFDEARHALPETNFAGRVSSRVRTARRRRTFWRTTAWLLVAAGAAAASPYIVQGSLALAARMEQWLPNLGGALVSPAGWVCSILFAFWILWRSKVFHR